MKDRIEISLHDLAGRVMFEPNRLFYDPESQEPWEELASNEQESRLFQVLEQLPARESLVLHQRFGLNGHAAKTSREIADDWGVSRQFVSKICRRALRRVQNFLRPAGGNR